MADCAHFTCWKLQIWHAGGQKMTKPCSSCSENMKRLREQKKKGKHG